MGEAAEARRVKGVRVEMMAAFSRGAQNCTDIPRYDCEFDALLYHISPFIPLVMMEMVHGQPKG